MAPDKALGLCFAGDERDVAKVSKWERGAVLRPKGWSYSWVCCSLWEGAVFDKDTNPTLMVSFGVGNFQPEFSAVLPFRRFTASPDR